MLTRNYDSLMTAFMTILPPSGYTPTETDWLGGKPGVVKIHNGVMKTMYDYPRSSYSTFGQSSNNDNLSQLSTSTATIYPVLLVGKSNAAESYNDYAIDLITNLSVVGYRSAGITYSTDGCIYTTVKTFINNTENDITVNELGLYQHYENGLDVLVYRKKLATPVTLKAKGGTATFSLVIDIPYANKP